MLITRRSRKPSEDSPFRSRFLRGDGGAFALRQYLRAREEVYQRIVTTVVQAVFALFLLMFARTMHHLFEAHGRDLASWVEGVCLGLVLVAAALVLRRVVRNVRDIRALRVDVKRLHEESRREQDAD